MIINPLQTYSINTVELTQELVRWTNTPAAETPMLIVLCIICMAGILATTAWLQKFQP
ncbi:MAG: hypothetical protein V4664_01310 [Patescibacteria group bacterium]